MDDLAYPWELDAQFVISTLTVLYYCYILVITMRSKSETFRSPFFIIFRFTGLFDIIGNIAVEWVRTDRKSGFGPSIEPFTRVMYAMTGVTFFTHLIGSLLMTVNRYMAVCFPWAYGKIWTHRNVYIMLFVDVIVSIVVHTQIFFVRLIYMQGNDKWETIGREVPIPVRFTPLLSMYIYSQVASVSSLKVVRAISGSAAIIYGCISVVVISRTMYVTLQLSKKSARHQKTGLVIFVAVDCLLGLVDCIYEAADLFGLSTANVVFVWISANITTLMFLILSINAYSMTFLSQELRMEAIAPCRKKKRTTTFTTTVVLSRN
ncbi:hypothetical protein ANCCAN_06451 [Ancylostoma caninum]|uniref:Serpentine receptor class gamma n=1 Tax=Ancylostoma caninum TaxID=29170 RepID=A0A368GVB1_ANCCA|nr:hypothetical protein ANCCAN_06451 [Ancylostoma caninum]